MYVTMGVPLFVVSPGYIEFPFSFFFLLLPGSQKGVHKRPTKNERNKEWVSCFAESELHKINFKLGAKLRRKDE